MPDAVAELWKQVEEQTSQLRTTLVEIDEMWAEISSRFGEILDDPGMPKSIVSEYLVGSAQQLKFMQRAEGLLGVRDEIDKRNRRAEAAQKIAGMNHALENFDQQAALKVFDAQTGKAFLDFKRIIDTYPQNLSEMQLSVYLAVYSPIFTIHDAFAAYLDRPRPGRTIWDVLKKALDDAGMEELGKHIPLLGLIRIIAEAMHKHVEGSYERWKAGVDQHVLFARLQEAVDEGFVALDNAEALIAVWRVSEDSLNAKFENATKRVTDVLKYFAKKS